MNRKTVAGYTLGCKVNQYDTEAMLEKFEQAGWEIVPFDEIADVYIINTCTVTGTGDQKSLKTVRRIARTHPECAIVVAGCLAQREAETISQMDNVRVVVGVQRRGEVVELLEKAVKENICISAVEPLKGAAFEHLTVSRHEGKTRATMKIQEGCDRYCAYCIIPYVRGPVRSMPIDDVRSEAQRLAAASYKEIVLTGIHLASYGRGTQYTLVDAIRAVCETDSIRRVRLGSLEPVTVTDDFAKAISEMGGVARQFHLSLQSGSPTVLKRMNRRYTPDEYYSACEILRKYMPECAVTTDIILGFPGETQAEFEETLRFAEKCRLARIHCFPYSRRSGTVADRMPNQISEEVKHSRTKKLIEVGEKLESDYVKSFVGSTREVLFETDCEGYTGEYVRVRASAQAGTFEKVRITGADGALATGEIIK